MWELKQGDCIEQLKTLPEKSIQTCVTSPPYWGLRDYGNPDQLGLEPTPELYVQNMVDVFREVKRVLRDDGTCWLNLGSSYINKNINSQEMVLRDDISAEELEYVMKELLLYGKQQKTLPSVR